MQSQTFDVPRIPVAAVQSAATYKPTRDDLVKQVKRTGSRHDRYPCVVVVRDGLTGIGIPGGYVLSGGAHEIEVDASEIETLKALVETDHATIAAATKQFQRAVLDECTKRHGENWRSDAKTQAEVDAVLADGLKRTSLSPEMFFTKMTGRGLLPLASVDVGQAMPPIELDTDANPTMVSAIAAAAAQAVIAGNRAHAHENEKNNSKRG